MANASLYRDVELTVEIVTNTKISGDLGDLSNTTKRTEQVKITGDKIEEALADFSDACGYNLTAKQMLEIVCKNANLIEWVSSGSFDSMTRKLFCDLFTEHLVGKSCPTASDSREYIENLFKDIAVAAAERGYSKVS